MSNWKMFFICALSGAAMGACVLFPAIGVGICVLAVPAFVLLLRQEERRAALKLCIAFCLGFCMVVYAPAFSIEPNVPENLIFLVDLATYIAVCVIFGALLTVALWCGLRLPCPKGLRWLAVALFWTLAEWVCGAGPLAWPTAQVSLALWQTPLLIRGARIGGQLLISAWIMGVNILLAEGVSRIGSKKAILPIVGAIVLFTANGLFGMSTPETPETDTTVAVVQPGLQVVADRRGDVYETAFALTAEAAEQKTDIILLPESILPRNFEEDEEMQMPWMQLSAQAEADLLVAGGKDKRSALYYLTPAGEIQDVAVKKREVPIFENGARGKAFRWIPDNNGDVLHLAKGDAGVLICYESMFSPMARQAVKNGADFLVIPTNDSWFAADIAKGLHLAHGVYRGVETGRSVVQAGLNGYTAVVDAGGQITASLPLESSAVLRAEISTAVTDTLYLQIGNRWLFIGIAIALAVSATTLLQRQSKIQGRPGKEG